MSTTPTTTTDFAAISKACSVAYKGFAGITSVYGWTAAGALSAAQAAVDAAAELQGEARISLLGSAYRAAKAAAKGYSAKGQIDKRDATFKFMGEILKAQETEPTPPTEPDSPITTNPMSTPNPTTDSAVIISKTLSLLTTLIPSSRRLRSVLTLDPAATDKRTLIFDVTTAPFVSGVITAEDNTFEVTVHARLNKFPNVTATFAFLADTDSTDGDMETRICRGCEVITTALQENLKVSGNAFSLADLI